MTDLVSGKLNDKLGYALSFENGNLIIKGKFDGPGVDVDLAIMAEPSLFLDQLKKVIPGTVDDAIIDAIKGAFLKPAEPAAPQA